MARQPVTKVDMLAHIYKLKTNILKGSLLSHSTKGEKEAAQYALSKVLDALEEYRM